MARFLPLASEDAEVNYFRCELCRHVWTVDKNDPAKITHVTPVRKDSELANKGGNPC